MPIIIIYMLKPLQLYPDQGPPCPATPHTALTRDVHASSRLPVRAREHKARASISPCIVSHVSFEWDTGLL